MTSFFSNKNIPVSRRSTSRYVPSGFLCLDNRKRETTSSHSKEIKNSIAVGPRTGCLCFDKQATAPSPPSPHPCCHQHGKNRKATAPGAPTPTRTTSGHPLQPMSPLPAQQPQSHCLFAAEKTTAHTHTMERANRGRQLRHKSTRFRPPKTSRMQATSGIHGLDNQPSSAVGATVLPGLRSSHSEPRLALLFLQHCTCFSRSSLIHMISQPLEAHHSPVLVRNQLFDPPPTLTRPRFSPLRLGDIALRAIHLGLEITLPEVRLDGHSDNVLHDNVLMVKVGRNSTLQLLQGINDLVEACVKFHHFDIQGWLN